MATADTAKLIASLELKDLFTSRLNNAERSLNKFNKGFDETNTRSLKAGRQIGVGLLRIAAIGAAAATAGAGVFAKAIGDASDLNETVSKVGVVFGKNAKLVLDFGKTSASALGLSQNAADAAAATYGNLFVSMGLASQKSADMSVKLVKLAGDLASFNNIDPAEALEKLRAGLTGESEPLKTLGININEQTLKAKALELGLVKLTKGQKQYTAVLDPATKAQAAYALIFEQSKTAQGDFARTSGGLANQIRILKANFTDMLASLASPTLPQVAKIFQAINKEIKANQPAIAQLGDKIAGLFTDRNIASGISAFKGAFQTIKDAAPAIADAARITGSALKLAVDAFKSLPKELQSLAIAGLAVNKITGGLVTNIAGGLIEAVVKRMSAALVNVSGAVVNVGGAAGATAVGGAVGGASKLGKIASAVGKVFLVGAAAGAFLELKGIFDEQSARNRAQAADLNTQGKNFVKVAGITDLQTALAGIEAQEKHLENTWDAQGFAFRLNIDGVKDAVHQQEQTLRDEIRRLGGGNAFFGITAPLTKALTAGLAAAGIGKSAKTGKDDVVNLAQLQRGALAFLSDQFKQMLAALKGAKKPEDIKAAVKATLETVIGKGKGNVDSTRSVLSALKTQLKNTHDPTTARVLKDAIAKVQGKIAGREFAQKQIRAADAILRKNESSDRKLSDLKTLQRSLLDRGLPHAAAEIGKRIDAAKRDQVYAARSTTEAIKDKDLTPKVTIKGSPITVNVRTTVADQVSSQATFKKAGNVYAL